MTQSSAQSRARFLHPWLLAWVAVVASACAGPKIATDLLAVVEKNEAPLIDSAVAIEVEINPAINNAEKLDESVKESLEIALTNAGIFGADSTRPYRIQANITVASQSTVSFGAFDGKLSVDYALFDESNAKLLEKTIYTEAGSDKMYFSGAKRHRRSRAVNISKNVLEFVALLQGRFGRATGE